MSEQDEYRLFGEVTAENVQIDARPGMIVSFRTEGEEARKLRHYARTTGRTVAATTHAIVTAFLETLP